MKKFLKLIVPVLMISVFTTACVRVVTGDKTADDALKSFNKIVSTYKKDKGFHRALGHWGLALGDGNKFEWSKDTAKNKIDFAMVLSAAPFIDAGLDTTSLNSKDYVYQDAKTEGNMKIPKILIHPFNVSDKRDTANGSEDAFRKLLKKNPSLVSFDTKTNLFTLDLGNGFKVLWPKTMEENKPDITFEINDSDLVKSGLIVSDLKGGWNLKSSSNNILVNEFKLSN